MQPAIRLLWGWVVLWPALVFGQGGPPMVTDDPGTVEPGHWELNLAWTREHRPGETVGELPLVDLNYGLNERAHFKYEVSWLRLSGDGSPRAGISDSSVGVKWRFWDEDRHGVAVSTYPQLGFRTADSSVRRGIATGATTLLLPLQVQRTIHGFEVNADAGYLYDRKSTDTWSAGLAIGRQVTPGWELMAELHGERAVGAPDAVLLANAGTRLRLGSAAVLLFSLGRELGNRTGSRATVSYLGLQLAH